MISLVTTGHPPFKRTCHWCQWIVSAIIVSRVITPYLNFWHIGIKKKWRQEKSSANCPAGRVCQIRINPMWNQSTKLIYVITSSSVACGLYGLYQRRLFTVFRKNALEMMIVRRSVTWDWHTASFTTRPSQPISSKHPYLYQKTPLIGGCFLHQVYEVQQMVRVHQVHQLN